MNPANFANMGVPQTGPQGIQQQGGPKRAAHPSPAQQRIFEMIQTNQQRYPVQGWQNALPIELRVGNVFQIFTQVRQVKYDMTPENAIQVAIQFEQKTYQDSADKNDYDQRCRSKLQEIARTRHQLAKAMQPQLQNNQHPQMNLSQQQAAMQGMPGMPNMLQQQQMQQQMQQQRLMHQQQNQVQSMAMPTQAQMQMGNLQARMQGMPPNMPQPVPQPAQQSIQQPVNQQMSLSQEEMQQIHGLAQRLFASQTQEQIDSLGNRLQQNNPNVPVQQLLQKYFNMLASQRYAEHKRQRASQMIPGLNGAPIPQQNRPLSQGSGPPPNQQQTPVSAPQTFDPSFMGSVDQMRQNALRSQELGQVVVPASQGIPQQQRTMGGAPPSIPQNGANRPTQTPQIPQQPQQVWNPQNGAPPQQANVFPNGLSNLPQNLLQGQDGGLTQGARTPQQNPNMPNLNRAFGPQLTQQSIQPQQNTPQMVPQNAANPQQLVQNSGLRLPMSQQQLTQMMQNVPPAERRDVLARMQAEHQKQRQQNGQGVPMQAQSSQQGQPMPANSQAVQNLQQTPRPGQQNVPPQQPVTGQPQPQPQQQQQHRNGFQQQQQQKAALAANNSLTSEQEQQMDGCPYPRGILATGSALSQLPESIKTWGQLKQWVRMNSNTVPPGSEQKLRGLQGLHYQSFKSKLNPPAQGVRNTAPPAQMTPGPNQPPFNVQIPQPTDQEIVTIRQRHPNLANESDERIKQLMMGQRMNMYKQKMNLAQQQAQSQLTQQGQAPQNQLQPRQVPQQQKPPQPVQRPQPQQTPKTGGLVKQPQVTAAPQAPTQSSTVQKGVKRNSSDDVVEVPNPNINQQRPPAKPQPKAPAANMGHVPPKPAEAPKSQATQREKPNTQAAQAPPPGQPKTAEAMKSEEKYNEIIAEVRQAVPQRLPVPMDVETREKMVQTLSIHGGMLGRMASFMPVFWKVFRDENGLKNLARIYVALIAQFKTNQSTPKIPVDHFTIGSEELELNVMTLNKYFNTTMSRMESQKNPAQRNSQAAKEPTPALSAANLQQHQNNMNAAREASMKKGSNRAPPAPTSAQAPNPWPVPSSPHGNPLRYGAPGLTQDKLQLPAKKKMKNNSGSAASTPAHVHGTPGPAPSPLIVTKSPEFQKTPAPAMLKCPIPNCSESFAAQSDLEKHMEKHEVKEPIIDDPLKFALEQMRKALNLDENGQSKPKADVSMAEAPKMKQSASMQGMKQEASTPMSRVPTGQSPASQSKALQPPKAQAISNALPDEILPEDPWANSLIRQETIHEAFSGLASLPGMKSFTRIQDYLTPESSTSDATDPSNISPRPSDVSENDAVKISMDMDKSWVPVDWYDDGGIGDSDFELLDLNVDVDGGPEPIELDSLWGETAEESQAIAERGQKWIEREWAAGRPGVAEEFARVYGPGEMNPSKR